MKLGMVFSSLLASSWSLAGAQSLFPTTAFMGSYGATAGAGSTLGWESHAMEANPAALGLPGFGLSVAGFSPFQLQEIAILEGLIFYDRRQSGTSLAYHSARIEGVSSQSTWQIQESLRLGWGWSLGFGLRIREEVGWNPEIVGNSEGEIGVLWRCFRSIGMGLRWNGPLKGTDPGMARLGADWGWSFSEGGMGLRFCGEGATDLKHHPEWKLGMGIQLHANLSLYSGWDQGSHLWALGIRFGLGNWEGFHALRRHPLLGSTTFQGLRWQHSPTKKV